MPITCTYCSEQVTVDVQPTRPRTNEVHCCPICAPTAILKCSKCFQTWFYDQVYTLPVMTVLGTKRKTICHECASSLYWRCSHCANFFESANTSRIIRLGNDSTPIRVCNNCISSHFAQCGGCGNWSRSNDIRPSHVMTEDDEPGEERMLCRACTPALPTRMPDIGFKTNPSKRYVGYELEFLAPRRPTLDHLGKIKGDGSVGSASEDAGKRGGPYEFAAIPGRGDALLSHIKRTTNTLLRAGAYANRTCGFHAHFDMSESDAPTRGRLMYWWRIFEPIFFAMVSPSRRKNRYCRVLDGANDDYWGSDRYYALNITAFSKFRTFEVRLHNGTVDCTKVQNWILIMLAFFDTFSTLGSTPESSSLSRSAPRRRLLYFMQTTKLSPTLRKYILKRIKKFGKLDPMFEYPFKGRPNVQHRRVRSAEAIAS